MGIFARPSSAKLVKYQRIKIKPCRAFHAILFASNYWRVTHIAHGSIGNPMCLMQSQVSFANGTSGWVMIEWAKGLTLGEPCWRCWAMRRHIRSRTSS